MHDCGTFTAATVIMEDESCMTISEGQALLAMDAGSSVPILAELSGPICAVMHDALNRSE